MVPSHLAGNYARRRPAALAAALAVTGARLTGLAASIFLAALTTGGFDAARAAPSATMTWEDTPGFDMRGGLAAFWDVKAGTASDIQRAKALSRGFRAITQMGPYSDYPGGQRQNIYRALTDPPDPWKRPPFFEQTVRRNIGENLPTDGPYIHDIEIPIALSDRAWETPAIRQASGADDPRSFATAYHRAWADWFTLPLRWTKETYRAPVGVYGLQPFRRDYWGVTGKSRAEIDRAHVADMDLWRHVDPYVDIYIASIYAFYDEPDTVMYFAVNVEENYRRTRRFGDKPVYAYTWLRFHESNRKLKGRELTPYLVEAMAITPFFSGARGVVLWGWEPQLKSADALPYQALPLYMKSLARVAAVSDRIGSGRLVIDVPAQALWNARRPLVRKIESGPGECLVMAINPFQAETVRSEARIACGARTYAIPMRGKHTTIILLGPSGAKEY